MIHDITLLNTKLLYTEYEEIDIFRHWKRILYQYEIGIQELPAEVLWFYSEELIKKIGSEEVNDTLDLQIEFSDYVEMFKKTPKSAIRSSVQSAKSAIALYCITMIRLMNARKDGEKLSELPFSQYILKIGQMLVHFEYFNSIFESFLNQTKDANGRDIVLKCFNPLEKYTKKGTGGLEAQERKGHFSKEEQERSGIRYFAGITLEIIYSLKDSIKQLTDWAMVYFVLKNEKRIGYDGSYEDFALNIIPLFQDVTVNVSSFSSICRKLSKRDNEVKDERLTERKKLKQQLTQKLEEALK